MLGNPLADRKKFFFTVSLAVGGYLASLYELGNPLPPAVTSAPATALGLVLAGLCVGFGT